MVNDPVFHGSFYLVVAVHRVPSAEVKIQKVAQRFGRIFSENGRECQQRLGRVLVAVAAEICVVGAGSIS